MIKISAVFILCWVLLGCVASYNPKYADMIGVLNFKSQPVTDKKQYVIMKDGSIVSGTKVKGYYNGVLLSRKVVHIDGKDIRAAEVSGFQTEDGYYAIIDKDKVIHPVISGRVNVYTGEFAHGEKETIFIHYMQKQNGPIREIDDTEGGINEVKQMVSDCKKAHDMINISYDEYKKINWSNRYYTQQIIETYNSCGEWK